MCWGLPMDQWHRYQLQALMVADIIKYFSEYLLSAKDLMDLMTIVCIKFYNIPSSGVARISCEEVHETPRK